MIALRRVYSLFESCMLTFSYSSQFNPFVAFVCATGYKITSEMFREAMEMSTPVQLAAPVK
jgi:hypothetical protein